MGYSASYHSRSSCCGSFLVLHHGSPGMLRLCDTLAQSAKGMLFPWEEVPLIPGLASGVMVSSFFLLVCLARYLRLVNDTSYSMSWYWLCLFWGCGCYSYLDLGGMSSVLVSPVWTSIQHTCSKLLLSLCPHGKLLDLDISSIFSWEMPLPILLWK